LLARYPSGNREVAGGAFLHIGRRILAAVPALDHAALRFEGVAGSPFVVLAAEVALHVAMAAAFHPIVVDGETIIAN